MVVVVVFVAMSVVFVVVVVVVVLMVLMVMVQVKCAPVRRAWGWGASAPWQRHICPSAEVSRPTDHLYLIVIHGLIAITDYHHHYIIIPIKPTISIDIS